VVAVVEEEEEEEEEEETYLTFDAFRMPLSWREIHSGYGLQRPGFCLAIS
jgi:hypothetical protein